MSPSSSALKPYFNIGGGGGGGGGEGIGGETPKPMGTRARLQTPSCLWLVPANTDEFVTVLFAQTSSARRAELLIVYLSSSDGRPTHGQSSHASISSSTTSWHETVLDVFAQNSRIDSPELASISTVLSQPRTNAIFESFVLTSALKSQSGSNIPQSQSQYWPSP